MKTITVLIHVQVKNDSIDAFREITIANGKERADWDGNLRYDVFQDEADPTKFTIIEVFSSQATIDAYYDSDKHQAWAEAVKPMIEEIRGSDQQQIFP